MGAGITGLAAAHHLVELAAAEPAGLELAVFEASARAGGIVSSTRIDDLLLEDGPDSFITDKPEAVALCERLGLGASLLPTRPEFRRSFVVANGRLVPTPAGFQLLAPSRLGPFLASPLLSPAGRARALLELLIPPRTRDVTALADESLASFVTRRLGRELLERLAQPMIGGIYGADPARLSLLATFPRFLRLEAEHGSVIRGLAAGARAATRGSVGASGPRYTLFASLAGGMAELTDTLAARLPIGALRLACPVTAITPRSPGWTVTTPAGNTTFDEVIVTLPGPAASGLTAAFDAGLGGAIAALPRGSSVTVTFAFPADGVAHPRDGAGFVTPRREGRLVIGASFSDRKFAGRADAATALVRMFFDERAIELDDGTLLARARTELEGLLGIPAGTSARTHRVVRWPAAMPHYEVGHLDRIAEVERRAARWPGLGLAGNSYRGVGLPDCIRGGEAAAAAAWLRPRPGISPDTAD